MSTRDPLPTIDDPDRHDVHDRVRAAAFDAGTPCTHCDGDGVVRDGTNMIVHSMGSFVGADWDLNSVLGAVVAAAHMQWVESWHGHHLRVLLDDNRWMTFEVPHPHANNPSDQA